jgi:hypothetical protein
MSNTAHQAPRIRIGVIANNDRTAAELLSYLSSFGIDAERSSPSCESFSEEGSSLQAMVIFPDDFEAERVDRLLEHLLREQPALFQLILTRQPQRFSAQPGAGSATPPRVVMPRPTFGWQIVDAIRAHLEGEAGVER